MPAKARGLLAVLILTGLPALGVELGASEDLLSVEIHGFASQGFILTTDNNYLAQHSTRGSFEFTEVGINFSKALTERLRIGLQLFARDLGPVGNYTARFDWFHLDYRFRDWLGFRAGRVKLPFGLYNDTSDIDAARASVLLPQSVYPTNNRDALLAQTGGELYGYLSLGAAGGLDYRAYVGTIYLDLPRAGRAPMEIKAVECPYVVGARLLWETPLEGLRVGGSVQALRLDVTYYLDTALLPVRLPMAMWVASVEYAKQDLLLSAEFSRWHVRLYTDNQAFLPNTSVLSERFYFMASYRVARWLQPSVYYSLTYPSSLLPATAPSASQHDIAATLRFDINPYWLVKLEGHYMRGTALLDPALNDGVPLDLLPPSWAVFLVKTTATF